MTWDLWLFGHDLFHGIELRRKHGAVGEFRSVERQATPDVDIEEVIVAKGTEPAGVSFPRAFSVIVRSASTYP